MENKEFKNYADKAISDDDLEQVSGGAMMIQCRKCGAMIPLGSTVCPKCGQQP